MPQGCSPIPAFQLSMQRSQELDQTGGSGELHSENNQGSIWLFAGDTILTLCHPTLKNTS